MRIIPNIICVITKSFFQVSKCYFFRTVKENANSLLLMLLFHDPCKLDIFILSFYLLLLKKKAQYVEYFVGCDSVLVEFVAHFAPIHMRTNLLPAKNVRI